MPISRAKAAVRVPHPSQPYREGWDVNFGRPRLFFSTNIAAVADRILPAENASNRLGIGRVFLLQDAGRQRFGGVVFFDRNSLLQDDDAVVDGLIYKMHSAASDLGSVFECLLLGIETGKCGQQRWVDVEDAVGKGADKIRREHAHVSGQADEIDAMLMQARNQLRVVGGAGATGGWNAEGGNLQLAGGVQPGGIFAV